MPYFYRHVDDSIRQRVETLFAEHYPDLDVNVRSAELTDGGILVRGLSIAEREAAGPRPELATIDEMLLVCQTDLPTLVRSTPQVHAIVVRRPVIRATRRADGTWNVARLFPLPKFGERPPEITIEAASLELFDPHRDPASTLVLRDGHLKVTAVDAVAGDAHAPGESMTGAAAASQGRRAMNVRGDLACDHLQRVELDGTFDPAGGAWDFSGKLLGLEVSPDLVRALPVEIPSRWNLAESMRGKVEGQFHVRYAASQEPQFTFLATGQLTGGRVDDSRLPYPLTDLTATFRFDERSFAIDELTTHCGPAKLRLDLERGGYGENVPLALAAEARHLQLDPRLVDLFPQSWRDAWLQLAPSGEIDLDVTLSYDGRAWKPDVTVLCQRVAFSYHKVPYRLEHGTGPITLKGDVLKVGVTAFTGLEEVRIDGEIRRPGVDWHGQMEVKCRSLPLDKKLLDALPEKPRAVIASLHGSGSVNLFMRFRRAPRPQAPLEKYIVVGVNDCAVNYERFAYPLTNVRGTLVIDNDLWTFTDFEGTNDTARIRCQGHFKPTREGNELLLNFTGDDVPLEEELRDALTPPARRLWNDVKPQGVIHLDAQVRHLSSQGPPHIQVRAEPLGETASIEPIHFPYRLEKIHGVFQYTDGRLDMRDLRAEHGHDTRVSCRGFCKIAPGGGWLLHFDKLSAGRLHADRDVLGALPPRLRKAVTDLHLAGPVHVSGDFDLASSGQPGAPLQSRWNLDFDLQQVRLHTGVAVENINGRVNFNGEFDGQKLRSRGELAVDSLTYKDFQFTEVRGPVWIDDRQVLFGQWAAPAGDLEPKRHITSRLFGGYVWGDGWVTLEAAPRYSLYATLAGADLARCAQQCVPGSRRLRGNVAAQVNLLGQGAGVNQLTGGGSIQLTDADVYELPVMAQLLKIVSARPPDANAFDKSDIDFRIRGEHVYLPRIDFNGDAVSLRGQGEMGLDKSIRLKFYAVLGRDEFRIPLVSDVLGGASQSLMQIHVDGTLDRPNVRKQALPFLDETLQQLQAEMQGSRRARGTAATDSRPSAPRASLLPQRR